ncbi:hypothetical protein RJ639_011491 [Escallonia herrerae]|uniref:Uncharacterized protein n=1 Tax=Escallonia herrerae TaxID=1293975 RepID=A0AA88VJ35_9ASTE|nr:hypothetical protein RJ639_011491 [Escallonia herrerae]
MDICRNQNAQKRGREEPKFVKGDVGNSAKKRRVQLDGKRALEHIVSPTNNHPKRLHVKDVRRLVRAKPLCVNEASCVNDQIVVGVARGGIPAPRKQKQVKNGTRQNKVTRPTKRKQLKDSDKLAPRKQKQVKNDYINEILNLEGPNKTCMYCHAVVWYQERCFVLQENGSNKQIMNMFVFDCSSVVHLMAV